MKRKSSRERFLRPNKISLLIFLLTFFLSTQANAATTGLNWENPNIGGKNPYKITTDAVLNSQTLMKVVGCTGVVNKISGAVTGLLSNGVNSIFGAGATGGGASIDLTKLTKEEIGVLNNEQLTSLICLGFKGSSKAAAASIPTLTLPEALETTIKCDEEKEMSSKELNLYMQKLLKQGAEREQRESCFNGLAYTLAKNQLTSMTRETINWINTGFNGNPMYVQSMRSLTNSIEKNVVESAIDVLADGAFPYGGDFSKTIIVSRNAKISNGFNNFLGSLTSDLSAFLTDKDSYGLGNTYGTLAAKERASIDRFSNDFSVGGWDGYLALTQREQNNPLGFTMMASQYVADRINQQSNEMKDEISQNDGFLSQKECIQRDKNDKCTDWKTITPGSIIKEKLSVYINSPERQLEMADDINSVLNSLFTRLIENFRSEGLLGLSQEKYYGVDDLIGYGANGTGVQYIGGGSEGFWTPSYSSSSYDSSNFDILKDLGNTYYHNSVRKIGTWNAKTNNAKDLSGAYFKDIDGENLTDLNVDLGVYNYETKGYQSPYYYLTVNTPGYTKLFNNGYNVWAINDRAFWDGSSWQNWKAGEQSPIKKRGIIQIQKDYAIAAKEILKTLPAVMPKLGELDYCIPGPNPSFDTNSQETISAFSDFVTSLSGMYNVGGFLKRDSTTFSLAKKDTYIYNKYHNIFNGLDALLNIIQNNTNIYARLKAYDGKTIKNDRKESEAYEIVTGMITSITQGVQDFIDNYKTNVLDGIYGVMRDKYLEREDSEELTISTSYVPMIEEGYALTRDLGNTGEQLDSDIEKYKSDIITADLNTAKLNIIKGEVDKIIAQAQARRNEKLKNTVIPLIKQKYANTNPNMTDEQAFAQYKKDYATCFDEEYIDYLDYGDMVKNFEDESTRCSDNIDNDLDGKIDARDPDCQTPITSTTNTSTTTTGTRTGTTSTTTTRTGGGGSITADDTITDGIGRESSTRLTTDSR